MPLRWRCKRVDRPTEALKAFNELLPAAIGIEKRRAKGRLLIPN